MAPDAPEEAPGTALTYRPIAVAVVHTARRHAWRILVVSIVVSAVTVAVDLAADHLLDRSDVTSAVVGALSTSTVSLLGAVFLSGFLCRLVSSTEHRATERGKTEHGKPEHENTEHGKTEPGSDGSRIRDVLRSLPWGSLILADLLAALIIVIGLVALIIPGLIAITLLAVVGPVSARIMAGHRARAPARRGRSAPFRASGPAALLAGRGVCDPAAAAGQRGDRHPAGSVRPHQRGDHSDRAVHRRRRRRSGGRPAAGGTVLPADRRRARRGAPRGPAGGLTRARPPGPAGPGGDAR